MSEFIDVIRTEAWYGVLAFVVTVFMTPIAATIARKYGVLDMPDRELKPHERPTPYLGGAAICLGWSAALIAAAIVLDAGDRRFLIPVLLGGIAMSALGLVDDIREVPPKLRLALGGAIIAAVMSFSGIGLELSRTVLGPLGIQTSPLIEVPFSFAIGLFIMLGACNSTNLIDGLDGLCAGVTGIISLGFFAIAMYLAVEEYSREANDTRLIIAIAMLGATLGFLPLNFNPAKIFMGDAGSVLLGYSCGILLLLFAERGTTLRWMLGGLVVFALPIFDTGLAIVRRWRSGRSILSGDRSHFYDQLIDRGLSVRRVVAISYALAAFYALLGASCIWLRLRASLVVYLVVLAGTIATLVITGMARAEEHPRGATDAD